MIDLNEIFELYHNRLICTAMKVCRNREEAEDVVQSFYLHLLDRGVSFEGRSSLFTWLYRCVINQALMMKRPKRAQMETHQLSAMPGVTAATASPEASIVARLDLERAINHLPKGYRAALVAQDVCGLDEKSAAAVVGHCAGTQKSQLHKARRRVREALAGY